MSRAYIYMECPETGETATLDRLALSGRTGTFVYAPEIVDAKGWVPDPIRYPLSTRPIQVQKNGGVPGFIDDAMPDGWGERLLRRTQKGELTPIQLLLLSPNEDRAGNIMLGCHCSSLHLYNLHSPHRQQAGSHRSAVSRRPKDGDSAGKAEGVLASTQPSP